MFSFFGCEILFISSNAALRLECGPVCRKYKQLLSRRLLSFTKSWERNSSKAKENKEMKHSQVEMLQEGASRK
jgi:hypothetical protein